MRLKQFIDSNREILLNNRPTRPPNPKQHNIIYFNPTAFDSHEIIKTEITVLTAHAICSAVLRKANLTYFTNVE